MLGALVVGGAVLPPGCAAQGRYPVVAVVPRGDSAFNALVPAGSRLERIATGFRWAEGPAWRSSGGGYLLFSDVRANTIYRWSDAEGVSVFLRPSGFAGAVALNREMGTNGLAIDAADHLIMADDGNRQVARLNETVFTRTTLAHLYDGKRLNSPNDIALRDNGDIYFTDPPYGLNGLNRDTAKDLDFNGVYRITAAGRLVLLLRDLTFPNGIAFSPDQHTLYVSISDPAHPVWMSYPVHDDGSLGDGHVLYDATPLLREGRHGDPDGMAVDRAGNLFAAGPGGILVLSPEGRLLGTILTGRPTANCTFGPDGMLYITAGSDLLRIRTATRGIGS